MTVVRTKAVRTVLKRKKFLTGLARRHSATVGPARILFVFDGRMTQTETAHLQKVLCHFSRVVDVDFASGQQNAEITLQGALAKLVLQSEQFGDPLGDIREVMQATKSLRSSSGRLSARAVANAFGLSVSRLAKLLRRSRQSLSKTDDAESIQSDLQPFARAARLRANLTEDEFRSWLQFPNPLLGESRPVDLISDGRVDVVADLAEDMLTGSPG
jgi:hypothetical protein